MTAAAFLLRKPPTVPGALGAAAPAYAAATGGAPHRAPHPATLPTAAFAAGNPATSQGFAANVEPAPPSAKNAALLNALKEELFSLESEKISGTITPEEYAEVKPALEVVLKRALKRNS